MAFVKGQSGNPAGRPRRTDTEKRQRDAIKAALPGIIDGLILAAKAGDTGAAKLLLERVMPAYRPVDRPVTLPPAQGLADAAQSLLDALTGGLVTPDEGARVAAVIAVLARVQELGEIEQRVLHIEELLHGHQSKTE